jgi:hypothetical protein
MQRLQTAGSIAVVRDLANPDRKGKRSCPASDRLSQGEALARRHVGP